MPHRLIKSSRTRTISSKILLIFLFFCISCGNSEVKYKRLTEKAEAYVQDGKWDEARITLLSAIKLNPKNAQGFYSLAEVYARLSRYKDSVANYENALNLDPSHRDARAHLAILLVAAKQPELAESHVVKLLEVNPKDLEANILKANIDRSQGRLADARSNLEELVVNHPDNSLVLANYGSLNLVEGNYEKAEELFIQSVNLKPDNIPVRLALADMYFQQSRFEDAEQTLGELVELRPESPGLRFNFGEFLLRRGLPAKAEKQYIKTLENAPNNHKARDRLYDIYISTRRPDNAYGLTSELIELNPDNLVIHYFKGRDSFLKGQLDKADQHFTKAIQLLPGFSPAFRRLGLVKMGLGHKKQAVEYLNQAVTLDKADVPSRLALAEYYFRLRDYNQAKEHISKILQVYPRQFKANEIRADLELLEGNKQVAREIYELIIHAFPNSPNGYFKMALIEETDKNYDKAAEYYRKVLSYDKEINFAAKRLSAIILAQKGLPAAIKELEKFRDSSPNNTAEYNVVLALLMINDKTDTYNEKARGLLKRALSIDPELTKAYFILGRINEKHGDTSSSITNYLKYVDENPKHLQTRMLLAIAYEKKRNFHKAAEQYQKILAVNPTFAPAANNLAWILAEELDGSLDEALRLAEIAKQRLPDNPSVNDTLGWLHYRLGAVRTALSYLEDAVATQQKNKGDRGTNPEILYHLAIVKSALNDKLAAKLLVKKASKLAAGNKPLLEKLNSIDISGD